MESRRRRPDDHLRVSSLPVRHGFGHDDTARTRRAARSPTPARNARRSCDMRSRWPNARYVEDFRGHRRDSPADIRPCALAQESAVARRLDRHRLRSAGLGKTARNSDGWPHHLFRISPRERVHQRRARVGAAVGKNPICFVVPCHRVIGKSGDLTGYHWGITRKRAMLGWEAGMAAAA